MAGTDLTAAALAGLTPTQLVDLLAGLDPADERIAQLDLNALAAGIDPRGLTRADFVRALSQLDRLAAGGADLELSTMDPEIFADLIAHASKGQVDSVMSHPLLRGRVLDEIFRRMQSHFRPDRAGEARAVVHFRFAGSPTEDDGYDRYESVISAGTCHAARGRTADPRVTITIGPADFLKLITKNASAPVLFMTGKLKVRGDLGFAAGMMTYFDLPSPRT
ncbi:SCP2 sterol-binding domain-containing protein [Fodinicola feengrottensis]|uniref:SCP2 sterol-binding domain-containing protein n=1 Tax=Fodinicola feengrottensis TaxID=435914 RepID=A0ABN2GSB4_9ACTN|nr:SCP2 sterol-binding domain-containing protein [Fodinicola feengrottensis]